MSKTKFNGFEKWFLTTAIEHAVEQAEDDIDEAEKNGKRLIYAKGYFSMIGKELTEKVHNMTLKRDQ
jgi:UDP-2,3-diacylglucosamine pyrophosphatase LpxH